VATSNRAGNDAETERSLWTFLTNHTHVLLCIADDPNIRLRDVAGLVGITERAAQSIVADLVNEGYLSRERIGRRNSYQLHRTLPLRHQLESQHTVGELLDMLRRQAPTTRRPYATSSASGNGNGNGNHSSN
jgi:DNA-binding IclR family transcriptional regulator